MRQFNTIVVFFSVAISVQKRGNCSLAHTVVHTSDMTISAVQNVYDTTNILAFFSTGDFYHFFKNAVGLNVVKFKGWELVGWLVIFCLTAL